MIEGHKLKLKEKKSFSPNTSIRTESGNHHKSIPQVMDLTNDFAREGIRLGLMFIGMQERINHQLPVALFTDKKTKSTFAVEPGQDIKSKLMELRKKFRSFKTHLSEKGPSIH